jgi:hypothetical protein
MVLFGFLSQHIAPLQQRTRTAWLNIGENDVMWLEHGQGTDLDLKVSDTMLSKLSSDLISDDVVNPPPSCLPIFMDQEARSMLLKTMPTLDDNNVMVRKVRDTSRGVRITIMDATGGQGGAGTSLDSGKGKGKAVMSRSTPKEGSYLLSRDVGVSSRQTAPPEKKRRLIRSDMIFITEPASQGQHAPSKAAWGSYTALTVTVGLKHQSQMPRGLLHPGWT